MRYYYGAFREIEGGVQAEIPDITGCMVDGDTWEEAFTNAMDAMAGCLSARNSWPAPSDRNTTIKKAEENWPGETFHIIPVPVDEKILDSYSERVRVNINIPVSLLRRADEYRAAGRITRSRLITDAMVEYLDAH